MIIIILILIIFSIFYINNIKVILLILYMNNITYNISETIKNNIENPYINPDNSIEIAKYINSSWNEIPLSDKEPKNNNERYANQLDYDLNYSVKYLIAILEFYGFKNIKKLHKKKLIEKIIEFEFDENIKNFSIIEERKIF